MTSPQFVPAGSRPRPVPLPVARPVVPLLTGARVLLLQPALADGEIACVLTTAGARVARADPSILDVVVVRDDATDVVVLDAADGRADPVTLVRLLRSAGVQVPALVLLRREQVELELPALAAGADDVAAACGKAELLVARVRKLAIRRTRDGTRIAVGALTIDVGTGRMLVHGAPLALAAQPYKLLLYLARHRDRPVSHAEVLHEVWGSGETRANTVDVAIGRLNRRLASAGAGLVVRRVRARGWMLVEEDVRT